MNAIEKYIRERLGRADAPPKVDADDLWAGIESQLPFEDETPIARRAFPWNALLLGFVLLFVAAGIWMNYLTPATPTPLAEAMPLETVATTPAKAPMLSTNTTTKNSELTDQSGNSSNTPTQTSLPDTPASPAEVIVGFRDKNPGIERPQALKSGTVTNPNQHPGKSPSGKKDQVASPKHPPTAPAPKNRNPVVVEADVVAEDPFFEKPFIAPAAAPTPPPTAESDPESAFPKNKATPLVENTDQATADEPASELAPPTTSEIAAEAVANTEDQVEKAKGLLPNTDQEARPDASETAPSFKSRNGSRLSIGFQAGSSLLSRSYATSGEGPGEALNTAVKTAAGASFGLDLNYRITDKLSVSTGLEYHRTLNPFDYESVTDTMIEHPSEFNSGLIEAVARRRTTHNHRLSFFTVPLLINHSWTFGNFDLGVGAGVGLNFRKSATGKTLNPDGSVVTYDAASGTADVPDFFLSYRLRPVLSWQPKPEGKLRFELSGNLSYQAFGISPLSGVQQNGLLLGAGIGLRYGF